MKTKQYKSIELCSGIGGLALGIKKAGFFNKLLFEIDKKACDSLKLNLSMPGTKIINDDLNNFFVNSSIDPDTYKNIDLIATGLPCQSFSFAGKKKGLEDPRGGLFYTFIYIIKNLSPKIFLIENVKGLKSHNKGTTLDELLNKFQNIGYKIKWKVLNAWDYNVAQKRERIFIIGFKSKTHYDKFKFPIPLQPKLTLQDALKNVPVSEGAQYSLTKYKILKQIPPGGCWRNLPINIAKEYLGGSYYLGGGKTGIARRLSWNEPSLTLTTSPMQKQTERCHPDETRPFTIREYARIQTFPDFWKFTGSINNQYKQIGNAVPVNLAFAVAKEIMKALDN